jgi:hypothetical protein
MVEVGGKPILWHIMNIYAAHGVNELDKKGVNLCADLRLLRAFYSWYRKEKPDIVHHFTIKPVIYGSMAARFELRDTDPTVQSGRGRS